MRLKIHIQKVYGMPKLDQVGFSLSEKPNGGLKARHMDNLFYGPKVVVLTASGDAVMVLTDPEDERVEALAVYSSGVAVVMEGYSRYNLNHMCYFSPGCTGFQFREVCAFI